jgi:hypothetical protein
MGCFVRIHTLNRIPVLDQHGQQIDTFQVSGRMMLPLSIEKPMAGGAQAPHRYFLTLLSGCSFGESELVYAHEQIPVS